MFLGKLKVLNELDLGYAKITNVALRTLAMMTTITNLSLCGCTKITDDGLTVLTMLTSLTSVDLYGCFNISNQFRRSLKNGIGWLDAIEKLKVIDDDSPSTILV